MDIKRLKRVLDEFWIYDSMVFANVGGQSVRLSVEKLEKLIYALVDVWTLDTQKNKGKLRRIKHHIREEWPELARALDLIALEDERDEQ